MKLLNLGQHRRARLWLGTVPTLPLTDKPIFTDTTNIGKGGEAVLSGAVEIFVPMGPRFLYGLIGGRFAPNPSGKMNISIMAGTGAGVEFNQSLAGSLDHVRVGLPAEYAKAASDGILRAAKEKPDVTAGAFSIDCAAYGVLGSSQAIFNHLGAILVRMLTASATDESDEKLCALFPTSYK